MRPNTGRPEPRLVRPGISQARVPRPPALDGGPHAGQSADRRGPQRSLPHRDGRSASGRAGRPLGGRSARTYGLKPGSVRPDAPAPSSVRQLVEPDLANRGSRWRGGSQAATSTPRKASAPVIAPRRRPRWRRSNRCPNRRRPRDRSTVRSRHGQLSGPTERPVLLMAWTSVDHVPSYRSSRRSRCRPQRPTHARSGLPVPGGCAAAQRRGRRRESSTSSVTGAAEAMAATNIAP